MSLKIKHDWKNADTSFPYPKQKVEVKRPLSDWPQFIFGYWDNGKWFDMLGNEINVIKYRELHGKK